MVYINHGSDEADRINWTDGNLEFSRMVTMDLTVLLETMDLMESDGNNWFIETDGTNGTYWAERIDGADRSNRTLRNLSLEWRI